MSVALITLCCVLLSGGYYEAASPKVPLRSEEKTFLKLLQQRELGLRFDRRLSLVARRIAGSEQPDVREELQRIGWISTSAHFFSLKAKTIEGLATDFAERAERRGGRQPNRVGFMVFPCDAGFCTTVVLGRKDIHFKPFLKIPKPERSISLSGRYLGESAVRLELWLEDHLGGVQRRPVLLKNRRFRLKIEAPPEGKTLGLQWVATRLGEPMVLAQARLGGSGDGPWDDTLGRADFSNIEVDVETLRRQLLEGIEDLRKEQHLNRLRVKEELDAEALRHATRMQRFGFFAHRDFERGTVDERLVKYKVPFARVYENLALGPSAASILKQWMQSISHRQNILNRDVEDLGLSVIVADEGFLAVLILSQRPKNPGIVAARRRVKKQILRKRRGTQPVWDQVLSTLAQEHAESMALSDRLLPADSVVDALWFESDVQSAAADTFWLADVGELKDSKNLRDRSFSLLGLGLSPARNTKRGGYYITLLYGTP